MLEWIESTQLSIAIREGGLPYPIIGGIHLLAIALFGGALLAVDLRLLGWLMPNRRFSEVWYWCRPWKQLGFVVIIGTGLLLAWAEPVRLYGSVAFWIKMALLALVGVHALVFREKVYGHPEKLDAGITSQAKLAAVLSIVIWSGMILTGRLIAYAESFEPKSAQQQTSPVEPFASGVYVQTNMHPTRRRDRKGARARALRGVMPAGVEARAIGIRRVET